MVAIEVNEIVKKYKDVTALDCCSLSVEEGELFGLLGVNGAGKTTLIKVLCGLTKPTSGGARVYGFNVVKEVGEVKKIVDISPQETSVAPKLTVKENLQFFASLYYADDGERKEAVDEVVKTFALAEVLPRRAGKLSGGWQRRLSIAAALISRPKALFLDEPTLGLDVLARRELWNTICALKGRVTIVLTSHYLEEIEALCDRVAIMKQGKIIVTGTCQEIVKESGTENFEDAFVKAVTEAKV